jgi:hypothetical protein
VRARFGNVSYQDTLFHLDQTLVADGIIKPHPNFTVSPTSGYRLMEHAYAEIIQGLPGDIKTIVPVWDQVYMEAFHSGFVDGLDLTTWAVYCQLNKDYAYWTEKRRVGQTKGGHVAGLLTHLENGQVKQNILFDTGLGTLEALADLCQDSFWDEPLMVFITHGHIDHHAELMILSEIYCKRRGQHIHDIRPPLQVICTAGTQKHLYNTHRYGFEDGNTLKHRPLRPEKSVQIGLYKITPLAVDHFEGAVIYSIEFHLKRSHKIIIGWDLTSPPLHWMVPLQNPSLAFFEATTFTPMAKDTGHTSIEELGQTGFLGQMRLQFQPEQEKYGAYLVHYSGWEDPWGILTDSQLKAKFDSTFAALSGLVRVAERGQRWIFS